MNIVITGRNGGGGERRCKKQWHIVFVKSVFFVVEYGVNAALFLYIYYIYYTYIIIIIIIPVNTDGESALTTPLALSCQAFI